MSNCVALRGAVFATRRRDAGRHIIGRKRDAVATLRDATDKGRRAKLKCNVDGCPCRSVISLIDSTLIFSSRRKT